MRYSIQVGSLLVFVLVAFQESVSILSIVLIAAQSGALWPDRLESIVIVGPSLIPIGVALIIYFFRQRADQIPADAIGAKPEDEGPLLNERDRVSPALGTSAESQANFTTPWGRGLIEYSLPLLFLFSVVLAVYFNNTNLQSAEHGGAWIALASGYEFVFMAALGSILLFMPLRACRIWPRSAFRASEQSRAQTIQQ